MKKKELKPSDFMIQPWSSVFGKSENETIARNVMVILSRNGNEWRDLSFNEYSKERIEDGVSEWALNAEKRYFMEVVEYCKSPEAAATF